jgi:hypothetical protein
MRVSDVKNGDEVEGQGGRFMNCVRAIIGSETPADTRVQGRVARMTQ